ncbi:MAG: class I SAM-dependent methyltransferase [Betaproteobacteria bacterium]
MIAGRPEPAAEVSGDKSYDADYFARELHRDHWFRNNAAKRSRRWQQVLRMLEPNAGDRLLEIGCAAGLHTLKLAAQVREAIGIDRALAGIRVAQHAARKQGIDNAAFAVCDASRLSFADATFDKVAAIDFVEHVDDPTLVAVLVEVARVLAPGGRLAIYTPCATHYVEWMKARDIVLKQIEGHVAVRAPAAYDALLRRAGLAVQAQWTLPSDYPLFSTVDRVLMALPGIGRWFRFRICIVAERAPG